MQLHGVFCAVDFVSVLELASFEGPSDKIVADAHAKFESGDIVFGDFLSVDERCSVVGEAVDVVEPAVLEVVSLVVVGDGDRLL